MRIGIDLGGTKIEGILLEGHKQIDRRRIPTPRGNYQPLLGAIVNLIQQLDDLTKEHCSVGIGTPGSLDANGLLRNSNTVELNGKPLLHDLEELCQRKLRISNDANCFALSEAIVGSAKEFATVFGVILGTGVGGGLVINQQLQIGRNHIGGEWGHNSMPWMTETEVVQARSCYCGLENCVETFLSGPGFSQSFFHMSGKNCDAKLICERAAQHDPIASAALDTYEDQIARALASVINVVDPDCIVLGGGMSNIDRLYQNVPKRWGKYVFSDNVQTQLLAPEGGDSAGVKGAAWLWAED